MCIKFYCYLALAVVYLETSYLSFNFLTCKMRILIIYLPKRNVLKISRDNIRKILDNKFLVHSNKYCYLLTNKHTTCILLLFLLLL